MHTTRTRRALAAFASTAVAAAGLAAFAPAAQAATTSINFDCSVSILTGQVFKLDVTPELPAEAVAGSKVDAKFSGNLTVPGSTVGAAYSFLLVRSLEGDATIRAKVGAQDNTIAAKVPTTAMPESGDLVIPVSGSGAWTVPATPGVQDVTVSGFTAPLVMKKADGTTQEATVECVASPAVKVASIDAYDPAAPVPFTCTASILVDQKFALAVKSATPAKAEQGKATTLSLKGDITVPASTVGTAVAFLGGKSISGPAKINAKAGGSAVALSATIPSTVLPATGDLVIPVTASGTWKPTALGTQTVTVPGFTATLDLLKTDGTSSPVPVDCIADKPNRGLASVEVVKAAQAPAKKASKTTATVKVAKKSKKATASVTVKVGKKNATGKVTLKLKKGKKVVGTKTVSLKKGKAKFTFKKKLKKGSYSLTASYKGNKSTKTSKKVVKFRVK